MNDDDKKPLVPDDGVDESKPTTEADETKVEVKTGGFSSGEADKENDKDEQTDEIDITAALKGDDNERGDGESLETDAPEEPEEEVNDLDRELDRVEGIESTSVAAAPQTEAPGEPDTDDPDVTSPVDMEEKKISGESENESKEHAAGAAFVSALKHQDEKTKESKSKAGLVAIILALLVLVAGAGAAYFYFQWNDTRDQLSSIESELSSEQAKNSTLTNRVAELGEQEQAAVDDTEYVVIPELGVRYKPSEATENLVFGYTLVTTDTAADAVAVSTKQLVKLSVGTGNAASYPCAFTGNVPTIARYATDVKIGDSTASKLGKQIGDAYYVYTAPTGNCAPTEIEAQTARNTAAKAVFDSLEVLSDENTEDGQTVDGGDAATTNNEPGTTPGNPGSN